MIPAAGGELGLPVGVSCTNIELVNLYVKNVKRSHDPVFGTTTLDHTAFDLHASMEKDCLSVTTCLTSHSP